MSLQGQGKNVWFSKVYWQRSTINATGGTVHFLLYARSSLVCSSLRELLSALQPRAEPSLSWDIWACGMNVSTHISTGSILFLCSCSANGLYQSIVSLMGSSEICSVLTDVCQIAHWAAQGQLVPLMRLHQPYDHGLMFTLWCDVPQRPSTYQHHLKRICKTWQRNVPLMCMLLEGTPSP